MSSAVLRVRAFVDAQGADDGILVRDWVPGVGMVDLHLDDLREVLDLAETYEDLRNS